jgi:two-component system LytT family response regulator
MEVKNLKEQLLRSQYFIRHIKDKKVTYEAIKVDEITFLESEAGITHFFLHNGTRKSSSENLGTHQKAMIHLPFYRVHHSYLINLMQISKVIKGTPSKVVLKNGGTEGKPVTIPISDKYKKDFFEMLKISF